MLESAADASCLILIFMPSKSDRESKKEQLARERGKALPFYAKKVAKALTMPKKSGKVTPSKRG